MVRLGSASTVDVRFLLCDKSPEVLEAWRSQFAGHPDVEVREASVLDAGATACLCPGNAFGFMDGGLALHLSERLGWHLQDTLRRLIREEHDGELLVGQALVLPTGAAPDLPAYLVYAPTVRTPGPSGGSLNAYLALRGALIAVRRCNDSAAGKPIDSLAAPGLATGSGGMHPHVCARQMRIAFEIVSGRRGLGDKNLSQLARREAKLKTIPAKAEEGED